MEECKTCANYKPRLRCGDDQCIAGDGFEALKDQELWSFENGSRITFQPELKEAAKRIKIIPIPGSDAPIYQSAIRELVKPSTLQYYYVFLYDEKRRPRVSICYIFDGTYYHRGVAICAPSDYAVLRKQTGAKIARDRAETAYRAFLAAGPEAKGWGLVRSDYVNWLRRNGESVDIYYKHIPARRPSRLQAWERYEILRIDAKRIFKAKKKPHTMPPPTLEIVSSCCGAPVHTEMGTDGYVSLAENIGVTCWYVCDLCYNPCDIRVSA